MNRNDMIQAIHIPSLQEFWKEYMSYIEKLHAPESFQLLTTKQVSMINALEEYLFRTGINKINATNSYAAYNEQKVNDFVNLYQYLLKYSENDFDQLIDLLFAIPEQYERDFKT